MKDQKIKYRKVKTKMIPTVVKFNLKDGRDLFIKGYKCVEVKS